MVLSISRVLPRRLSSVCILFLCCSNFGYAQTLEEITVTAQKREQNLQDVASSVSALSGETIAKIGADQYREWADFVAGVTISESSFGSRAGPNAVIRGISNDALTQLDVSSATATSAIMLGDIPVFSIDARLADMSRIEVLRGPQGTLYGAAAMGGLIKYVPNSADTGSFEAALTVGGGLITDGGTDSSFDGMINVPLIDGVLAARVVGYHRSDGGWIDFRRVSLDELQADRIAQNAEGASRLLDPRLEDLTAITVDANSGKTSGGRISLLYTPNDRITIEPVYSWQKSEMRNKPSQDLNNSLDLWVERYLLEPWNTEYQLFSIKASVDLGFGELIYVGGYYEHELGETSDGTELAVIFKGLAADGTIPAPFPLTFRAETEQTTHEIRLQDAGVQLGGMSVDYTVGAFYQDEKRSPVFSMANPDWNLRADFANNGQIFTSNGLVLGGNGFSDFQQTAFFGNVTVHINDNLFISAGARHYDMDKHDVRADFGDATVGSAFGADNGPDDLTAPRIGSFDESLTEDGWTPAATIGYNFSDNRLLYFTASTGFRVGGSNSGDSNDPANLPECNALINDLGLADALDNGFESDSVLNYELGLKSVWLNQRLLINASLFFMDWSDLQQQVQLSRVNPNCLTVIKANVGAAESKGIELESTYAQTDNLTWGLAIAYTDAEITEESPGVPILIGSVLPRVPEWTAAVSGEYQWDLPYFGGSSAFLRADWRFVDERLSVVGIPETVDPFFKVPSYNSTNIRLGVDSEDWSGAVYVTNVFDQEIIYDATAGFLQGWLYEGSVGKPRTVGFSLTKRF